MPYKQGKKWRGIVKYQGQRYQALLPTKKSALDWEKEKRDELAQKTQRVLTGTTYFDFCERYLDYADRFTAKVYDEKRLLCQRTVKAFGREVLTEEITPDIVLAYLETRAKTQSANAFNKDRKNLLAMWNWGQTIFNLADNPISKITPRPHDRAPQYTPPTEDVLKVLAVTSRDEKVFLSCYLQTAARRSEIFRWTWIEDINFERREYRLGTRKTRSGSMEYEWFPMSDELYEDLWWWWNNRTIKNTPYVFVSTWPGQSYGKPFTTRRQFMKGLCKRADVKSFGFQALRRYVASVLADNDKVGSKTIQRILRHRSFRTTERYIHGINRDLRPALNMLSEKKVPQGSTPKQEEVNE